MNESHASSPSGGCFYPEKIMKVLILSFLLLGLNRLANSETPAYSEKSAFASGHECVCNRGANLRPAYYKIRNVGSLWVFVEEFNGNADVGSKFPDQQGAEAEAKIACESTFRGALICKK